MMPLHRAAIQGHDEGRAPMNVSTWTVAVASLVLFGCATAPPTRPPSVNVTGQWRGNFVAAWGTIGAVMTLAQTDANVAGDLVVQGSSAAFSGQSGPIRGSVNGDVFSFVTVNGSGGADLTVKGNEMTGPSRTGERLMLQRQ